VIMGRRAGRAEGAYRPQYGRGWGRRRLVQEAAVFFGMDPRHLDELYGEYRRLYRRLGYRRYLSERKTLCFPEAFIFFVLFRRMRPKVLVEIGTQFGQSTRRLRDMADHLNLETRIICYDIADELRYVGRDEVELVIEDVTGRARTEIFEKWNPEIVFLDARPYRLIQDVVRSRMAAGMGGILVIHDCIRGLYNPNMKVSRDDPHITSRTGVWERHVLAEEFGIADPRGRALDYAARGDWVLRIFGTPHGLAVMAPRAG